jgi:hypothetical protein
VTQAAIPADADLAAAVLTEIDGLHRFFTDWFLGRCPRDRAGFARCADALAPDFAQVDPAGRLRRRGALLTALWAAHGCHARFAIRIRRPAVRLAHDGLALAVYEEWQRSGAGESRRRSSALFAAASAAPLGVAWLHLHETWIEAP